MHFNEDIFKGKWKEAKGEIRKMWGKLTDDDLEQAKGDLTALTGIIQRHYGESKESIHQKLDQYFSNTWGDIKSEVSRGAQKAKDAMAEAAESARQKW